MNTSSLTPRALDEILAGLHEELEDGASGVRVREIADAHPEARADILAFAADWCASGGSDLSDEDHVGNRTAREHHQLLERVREAGAAEDAKPFARLSADRLDEVAQRCRIDRDVLRQLVRGRINEMSVPGKLVGWLGVELDVPPQAVWSALSSGGQVAYADFFAPDGRKPAGKTSFADVIRRSSIDATDKRFWLDLLDV